jgi:hypothetical protein
MKSFVFGHSYIEKANRRTILYDTLTIHIDFHIEINKHS